MAFKFSLASILRFRETIEKKEEITLQRIQFEIARAHSRLEEDDAKIVHQSETLDRAMQRGVQANLLQAMLAELQMVVTDRQDLALALEVLQQKRKLQMKAYQAAHAGRQMLTDMLVQKRDAYELHQARVLQRQLDDVFTTRSQDSK